MNIEKLLNSGRNIRVLGIDDAHYPDRTAGSVVNVTGVICASTRFEGMLWSSLTKDGLDATDRIGLMIRNSKFAAQIHLLLLDGITFGGGNVADLPALQQQLGVPVVAVMRRPPNMQAFESVLRKLTDSEERLRRTQEAGPIHCQRDWTFQCCGETPEIIARALDRITDNGKVPEALRLAHLIGSAVMLGESTKRA